MFETVSRKRVSGVRAFQIFLHRVCEDLETFLESEKWKEVVRLWLATECSENSRKQQSLEVFVKNFIDFLTLHNKISRII